VPWPWAPVANLALILQFQLAHSLHLTGPGGRRLARPIPGPHGATLAITTYAIIAAFQLLALFVLRTPSGSVWWRAEGRAFWAICAVYASRWLLLIKASSDAGAEVQSGALGWMSLLVRIRPVFPDMPTDGLFRVIRQPIYVAICPDTMDRAGLDAGPVGACCQLQRLLPSGVAPQGTPLCRTYWRPVPALPRHRTLCRTTTDPSQGQTPCGMI